MTKIFNYNRRTAIRKGHKDGADYRYKWLFFCKEKKQPYPLIEQPEPAIFEDEILRLADTEIAEIAEIWKGKDKILKTTYCDAKALRDRAYDKFLKEEKEIAPEEANLKRIDDEIMQFQEAGVPHWLAVIFHIILFASEVFFNSVVFQTYGFEKLEAILSAVGIGLALTFCAYNLGKYLKKENRTRIDTALIYVIPIVVVFGMIAISIMRGFYMLDVERITHVHFSMSPKLATVMFFLLNIVLFVAGAIISYASFSKNEALKQTLKKRYKHAIKRLKKERKEAQTASINFEKEDKKYIKIKQVRQKEYERLYTQAKTVKETAEFLISVYRVANLEKRLDSIKPNCFKVPPREIFLPIELLPDQLDWDCNISTSFSPNAKSSSN